MQEYFTYLKWLGCGLMGLWLFGRSRERLYLSWAALFLCFFVEDAASLRDQAGAGIASIAGWGPAAGLTEQGLGEFAAAVVVGVVLLGAVAFVYSSSDHKEAKAFSRSLAPLLGGLIIFGIGVDTVHAMVGRLTTVDFALGVLEEGGEIIIASMLIAVFYNHTFPERSFPAPDSLRLNLSPVSGCGCLRELSIGRNALEGPIRAEVLATSGGSFSWGHQDPWSGHILSGGDAECRLSAITRAWMPDAVCLFHRDCKTAEVCIRHQPDLASREFKNGAVLVCENNSPDATAYRKTCASRRVDACNIGSALNVAHAPL